MQPTIIYILCKARKHFLHSAFTFGTLNDKANTQPKCNFKSLQLSAENLNRVPSDHQLIFFQSLFQGQVLSQIHQSGKEKKKNHPQESELGHCGLDNNMIAQGHKYMKA